MEKAKGKGKEVEPAVPRSIVKRSETAAAEKKTARKKEEKSAKKAGKKAVGKRRWENGDLTAGKWKVYGTAANLLNDLVSESEDLSEMAVGERIPQLTRIRTLEQWWEEQQKRQVSRVQVQTPVQQQQQRQSQHHP